MVKKIFSFLLFCNFLIQAEELNLIESVKVSKNALIIKPNKELSKLFLIEDFMLQYDDVDIDLTKLDYSIIIVPFLLHVIPIIWQQDKTYIIERMDKDLYESLEKIRKVFRLFYPSRNWSGVLKAKAFMQNSYTHAREFNENRNAVIIPFSGGVDSIYNSLATIDKKQYLVTICGGDVPIARPDQWLQVKNHCTSYAQQYNLPLACVRSNFAGIYNWDQTINHPAVWTYMTQGLGYTSLMIPFMVAKGIPFCLIGSASVVDCPWPYGSHPLIEHNLKIAGCYSFHFGAELTRSEKIGKILEICKEHSLKKPKLRVCWKSEIGSNCCECFSKCIVTMVCLLVEGEDYEDFGFTLPLQEVVSRLKSFLTEKPLDSEGVWRWRFVQRRIKELRTRNMHYNSEVAEFVDWLENFDLDQCIDKNKPEKYSSQIKSILSSLWSDSLEIARMRFNNHFALSNFGN